MFQRGGVKRTKDNGVREAESERLSVRGRTRSENVCRCNYQNTNFFSSLGENRGILGRYMRTRRTEFSM